VIGRDMKNRDSTPFLQSAPPQAAPFWVIEKYWVLTDEEKP
jgi:hypothetical protein